MKHALIGLALLLLAACGGGGSDRPRSVPTPPTSANLMNPAAWELGPVIDGESRSPGVPLHPYATAEGWGFDFPPYPGSVHYVTARLGSLTGKSRIVLRYRVELVTGELVPATGSPGQPSIGPTLYFQRRGDDWDTDGWRWWATFASPMPIEAGDHELVVPLDGPWTSVERMTAATNPAEFASAKADADRVGFTFGGGTGFGHGVYATGRARFIVTSFSVE